MLGRDDRHAAGVRLRAGAPLAAMVFPLLLVLAAGGLSAWPCDRPGGSCASQSRAVALLAIAAPTLPALSLLAPDLPALLTLLLGVAASVPAWGALGGAIARRLVADEESPVGWRPFWRRYALACAVWVVLAVAVIVLYRRLAA